MSAVRTCKERGVRDRRGPWDSGVPLAPGWAGLPGAICAPQLSLCLRESLVASPASSVPPQSLVAALSPHSSQPPQGREEPPGQQGSVGPFISKAGIQSMTQ